MLWDDTILTKFIEEGEKRICVDNNIIIDRISLGVTAGSDELTLPNYITGIRRVTWKGCLVWPYNQSEYIESGTTPYTTTQGRPYFYITNYKARNLLRLLPTPNETLAVQATNLWEDAAIRNGFIIEFHRLPDFSTSDKRLPSFMNRQFVKDYVLQRCMGMEGKGNSEKNSQYFESKQELNQRIISKIKSNIFQSLIHVMEPDIPLSSRPGRPVLPPNFGVTF